MTKEELRIEFYEKLESQVLDNELLIIASIAMETYIKQRQLQLENEIGADSFKGTIDGR